MVIIGSLASGVAMSNLGAIRSGPPMSMPSCVIENYGSLRCGACMWAAGGIKLVCLTMVVVSSLASRVCMRNRRPTTRSPCMLMPSRIIKCYDTFWVPIRGSIK